jgi:uncharacterized protein
VDNRRFLGSVRELARQRKLQSNTPGVQVKTQINLTGSERMRREAQAGSSAVGVTPRCSLAMWAARSAVEDGSVREVRVERVLQYATPQARASRLHGPIHWRRVASFGAQLSRETLGADAHVVAVFAMLHDTQRFTDGHDPDHGRRAAETALDLRGVLYEATEGQMALLEYALRLHADGLCAEEPTVACCWDADRLDLPRCGIRVDPRMLSTEAGKRKTRVVDRLMGDGDAGAWR